MRIGKLAALWVLGLLAVGAAGAQTGTLEGTVLGPDEAGIEGVTVAVDGASTLTGPNGTYRLTGLAPGTYTLSLALGDYAASEEGVEVRAGETTARESRVDWQVSLAETITVFSASRQPERIVEAPQAISVVSEEEIEREAASGQLPKLLEFTPGAEVTQSGIYDYNLNTRGFNSSLNRRVAVLVDGRDPSVPFLGAQEWAAVSFPLDDLASAEFVRGPSAALYGANASSGVLNLVTKQPRYSQGGKVRLAAGELSTVNADLRWATELSEDSYFKVVGGLRDSGDFSVSRTTSVEYTAPCPAPRPPGAYNCLPLERVPLALEDDDQIVFGSLRFDHYLADESFFTLEAGQANVEGPLFQTGIGRVQLLDVERPWARLNYTANHWNGLVSYNRRKADEQLALASGANLALDDENVNLELQGHWDLAQGQGRVVVGGLYQDESIDSEDPRTGRQTLIFEPIDTESQAVYGQFDWNFSDAWKLVLAGRWDDSDLHDSQFSPKGAIVYSLDPNNTVRLTYTEAFQVANYSEFFLQAPAAAPVDLSALNAGVCLASGFDCGLGLTPVLALGNASLEIEEVSTFEVGYSGILAGKAFLTVDYYNSDNENFITDLLRQLGTPLGQINPNFGLWQAPASVPAELQDAIEAIINGLVLAATGGVPLSNNLDGSPIIAAASYTNIGQVDTQGVDVGLNYYLDENWSLAASYSWFDFDIGTEFAAFGNILLPNSPENKFSLGVAYAADRWDLGVDGRWVDEFQWAVGPFQGDVESYTTVDLVGNYHLTENWSVGINVANLFDEEHWESFGGDVLARRALGHVSFGW